VCRANCGFDANRSAGIQCDRHDGQHYSSRGYGSNGAGPPQQHALSDRFIAHILTRNIRIEEDLIDPLFNSSEKRLARTLLFLARYGKPTNPRGTSPARPHAFRPWRLNGVRPGRQREVLRALDGHEQTHDPGTRGPLCSEALPS
jgi:hypothetical protein